MNETEQALRQALNQDRLCHIDMIDSLDRGFAQILLQEPEGLLTYDAACQKYGLTAKSPAFVEKALAGRWCATRIGCWQRPQNS